MRTKNPLRLRSLAWICFLALFLVPSMARAHHVEWMNDKPFVQGLSMPIHGLDHMLVTFAVGLMAVQIGGRARRLIPVIFTAMLVVSGILNMSGVSLPLLEHGILASIAIAGGMLIWKSRVPAAVSGVLIALFAAYHGQAIVSNGGFSHNLPVFVVGCAVSALALQGLGMTMGLLVQDRFKQPVFRYVGVGMMAAALVIGFFPSVNDVVIKLLEG